MKILNSRVYNVLLIITDYFLVGILWLIGLLPLFTIISSCNGIVYAMKKWSDKYHSREVIKDYFYGFKKNIISSTFMSCVLLLTSISFVALFNQSSNRILISFFFLSGILIISFFIRFIQLNIEADYNFLQRISVSLTNVIVFFLSNLMIFFMIFCYIFIGMFLPETLFIFSSLLWLGIYKLLNKKI